MPDVWTRFGGTPAMLGTSDALIYTASQDSVLKEILVANVGGALAEAFLSIGSDTAAHRLLDDTPLDHPGLLILDVNIPLAAGDTIRAHSSLATTLNVTLCGLEDVN